MENLLALFLLSFLWGACYEAFTPAAFSETVAHSNLESRKVAFSCNRLAINIGMAIGPLLGSLIFLRNADAVFYINAVLSLLAFAACLRFDGPGQPPKTRPSPARARACPRWRLASVRDCW